MKTWETVLKVLAALIAAVVIIFVIVTYGDKIVAWFKKLFTKKRVTIYENEDQEDGDMIASEGDFAHE